MQVDVENASLVEPLQDMARLVVVGGGHVAEDLTVRERSGELSCAIGRRFGEAGRVLVDYPSELRPRLSDVSWAPDTDWLSPTGWAPGTPSVHRELVQVWAEIVNRTGKAQAVRQRLPVLAITEPEVRRRLATAGYDGLRAEPSAARAREHLFAWHSAPERRTGHATAWRLLPLKCFVNHDPTGSPQVTRPGRTRVVTSSSSDAVETFEDYGDLDALQLLMHFGYVDASAEVVHSLPVRVGSAIGEVEVVGRRSRKGLVDAHPLRKAVPDVTVEADRIQLNGLSVRPGNQYAVRESIAMLVRSRTGAGEQAARLKADQILDAVLTVNDEMYDDLAASVAHVDHGSAAHDMLATVCAVQRRRLRAFWR